ncbi:MAG: fructose-specific PTS transporter subunit EIIC [Rhodospirillum sp.]|nr:fructose-specific PTS transporter subunit EIIC [Rhodospirillum sp.]MCF8491962.1 fructose-specific PTS transporter subunit EIIC [Rhodospirillum sp.]MCF8501041.1 fructose-specific PTS transporter subunit EIIC [Rhodospirillum sp.]
MSQVLAVIAAGGQSTQATLAAEALRKAATTLGQKVSIEVRTTLGIQGSLPEPLPGDVTTVLLIGDGDHASDRFTGLRTVSASLAEALDDAGAVLNKAFPPSPSPGATSAVAPGAISDGPKRIVGITSCPTGIAHTFMAAEGLEQAAKALGHEVRVETQGSVGSQNQLTEAEIAAADIVLIAADTQVNLDRFVGKRVYQSDTKAAIGAGKDLVRRALAEATVHGGASQGDSTVPLSERVKAEKAAAAANRTGPYKHLMTGVSFMLPFVVAGGLLIAIAFALGGIYVYDDAHAGTLGQALFQIGAKGGFALMVPALAGYIAYSIADRPGIAPGMIGGMMASTLNAGFLGGIVAGFIAGYVTAFLNRHIKLHRNLEGLKPVLILPLLGTAVTGLLMIYVIGTPVAEIMAVLTEWLKSLQGGSAILLGLLIGAMMAFDMGGPVNKAAYAFSTGMIASEIYAPMAAAMAAGMTPPLALALACKLFPNRFLPEEREAGPAAAVLGISFITEGAIPFAARDPLRVIPSLMAGSAVTGAITMALGVGQKVPHGGIFILPIPNAVTNVGGYIVALLVGIVVTTVCLRFLKRPITPVADA